MFTAAEIAEHRADAEARMTSRATVRRRTGRYVKPPGSELEVEELVDVYVDLPCRIDAGGTAEGGSQGVTLGGVTFEDATGVGHFPFPSADLADDDVFQVTYGEWPGEFYRVVAAIKYDQKTARRLPIVETVRPEGWPT